jgi:hypothetical protein
MLLKSATESEAPSIAMTETKLALAAVTKARGWDASENMATKLVYEAVAKRVVKINRKGGGGGRVTFAE